MSMKSVTVYAPASTGNIGPAFDVLGMAIDYEGDMVEATVSDEPGVRIESIKGAQLSTDPHKNTAGIAAQKVLEQFGITKGVSLRLTKGLPCGSGLGSSAASAVAGGYATAMLFCDDVEKSELIEAITRAEEAVSGAFFCDNTASSLLGGVVLTRSYNPLEVFSLGGIEGLHFAFVKPDITILTEDARKVIPSHVPLDDVKVNNANTAGLVTALMRGDAKLFARSIDDRIVEPNRAKLIPVFDKVKASALHQGALGASISGGGPTIFAACTDEETARNVSASMKETFTDNGIESHAFVATMDLKGARVLNT